MTIINPSSISGITSITMPSGDGNVLTIHTNDGVERFRIDSSGNVKVGSACTISQDGDVFFTGVTTATTFTGSGANLTNLPAANLSGTLPAISAANLTNLPAANLTGALPAISGANLTGIAATDNVRTGILDVAGIATFRSDVNVPNINGGQISGRRNLLMNGAMKINQRVGTGKLGYFNPVTSAIYTLDRWRVMNGSSFDTDSAQITQSTQSPDGFSSSMKWDIGNTETPSANQNCGIEQKIEGQDLQGLAYGTSSAKTMTLSFHVYSNKTGTYCVHIMQEDGTKYQMHEYTISSSNTWEKKTITIVGNTANAINDDNTTGLRIIWVLTVGSSDHVAATSTWASGGDLAGTSNQVNLWDNADNHWYLTGCQLEIGTTATEFEHRGFGDELALCQRYYFLATKYGSTSDVTNQGLCMGTYFTSSDVRGIVDFPQQMRAAPSLSSNDNSNSFYIHANSGADFMDRLDLYNATSRRAIVRNSSQVSGTGGHGGVISQENGNSKLEFSADL